MARSHGPGEFYPIQSKAFTRIELLLVLVVFGLAAGLVIPAIRDSRIGARRARCLGNLSSIGAAIQSYLDANNQTWPFVSKLATLKLQDPPWPTLPVALKGFMPEQAAAYRCPADERKLKSDDPLAARFGTRTTWYETEGISYEWWFGEAYGGNKVGEETLAKAKGFGMGRADQPLLSDFGPFHSGDGNGAVNNLNADLKPRSSKKAFTMPTKKKKKEKWED